MCVLIDMQRRFRQILSCLLRVKMGKTAMCHHNKPISAFVGDIGTTRPLGEKSMREACVKGPVHQENVLVLYLSLLSIQTYHGFVIVIFTLAFGVPQ